MTDHIRVTVGDLVFDGVLETTQAPRTAAAFAKRLPFRSRLVQARWSGQAGWIPLGDLELGVGYENPTSYPAPGQVLWHPAGISEAEILFPYGPTRFASKAGQLAGNHFLSVSGSAEQWEILGRRLLWEGAQEVTFEALPSEPSPNIP